MEGLSLMGFIYIYDDSRNSSYLQFAENVKKC